MSSKTKLREDGTVPTAETSDRSANPVLDDLTHRLLEQESAFRAFLRKRLSDDAVTEDLLQQSLMKAVERGHELKKTDSAVSWFYRILRNAVTDYYRSSAADHRKVKGLHQAMIAAGEDKMPALDEIRSTVCTCLGTLLNEMRPAYAHLLERIDLKEESPAAVAEDLKLTTNNLTVRLHRARQALRAGLEQACGICTKHGCLNCTCSE
jgi:RNA polymerase sigma factor (sigma-70 family)